MGDFESDLKMESNGRLEKAGLLLLSLPEGKNFL